MLRLFLLRWHCGMPFFFLLMQSLDDISFGLPDLLASLFALFRDMCVSDVQRHAECNDAMISSPDSAVLVIECKLRT